MRARPGASLSLLCTLPCLAGGCAGIDSDDPARALAALSIDFSRCGATGCGVNGPDTDGHGYGELHAGGEVNELGYYISHVAGPSGKRLSLSVANSELVGRSGPGRILSGSDLVGAVITVRNVQARDVYWTLRVVEYTDVTPYWVGPAETIPSYRFAASASGGLETNLCSDGVDDDYEQLHHAFVFEGDRYDRERKTVSQGTLGSGWFNIACTGSTASKLLRLRHAQIAADGDLVTEPAQRQALYKAIVGDFCGTGEALTEPGVPLFLRLPPGWDWNFGCYVTSHEATWSAGGALCVDVYRLADDPELAARLEACGIDACTSDMLTSYWEYGWTRTSNPWIGAPGGDECVMFGG
jgi:hypothetical protein